MSSKDTISAGIAPITWRAEMLWSERSATVRLIRFDDGAAWFQIAGALALMYAAKLAERSDLAWAIIPLALAVYAAGRRLEGENHDLE